MIPTTTCPYCEHQDLNVQAKQDPYVKALDPNTIRYGCENGHFFALPKRQKERIS